MTRWLIGPLAAALLTTPSAAAQDEVDAAPVPYNVLLVTVDNLRPANMGVYGYERDTTPFMSSIADESVVFTNAFSTSAWTSPGMSSFFTGYWPPTHGQNGQHSWWDPTLPTAISAFTDAGYRATGRSNTGPTYANLGFQYQTYPYADIEEFIENRAQPYHLDLPFIGWMHLKEVHLPYNKGSAYHRRLWGASRAEGPALEAVTSKGVIYVGQQDFEFTDADKRAVRGLYDAAVARADARIGAAFEQLRAAGLLERTILIISADHGEEQFEHGWLGHASTSWDGKLFDESIRIPLIVRMPDASMTGEVDAMVQQLDLMPTLTELLNIPVDSLVLPMQGRSLLPLMRQETSEPPRELTFAQTTYKGWATPIDEMADRVTAVRSTTLKLIRYGGARGDELVGYDLVADPAEQVPIAAAGDQRFAALQRAMQAWDRDTTTGAATLALEGADRELALIETHRKAADPRGAMSAYSNLLLLDQTYGLEVHPFMEDPRYMREWVRKMRAGRSQVGRALSP